MPVPPAARPPRPPRSPAWFPRRATVPALTIPARGPAAGAARTDASPRYRLSLAREQEDVRAAQRLRHQVFAAEFGARLDGPEPGLEGDAFDAYCDHVLVHDDSTGEVVGTYRLPPPDRARIAGRLYAESEFDLSRLAPLRDDLVEVGRSCVHPAHRNGAVISLIWAGIARYMTRTGHTWLAAAAPSRSATAAPSPPPPGTPSRPSTWYPRSTGSPLHRLWTPAEPRPEGPTPLPPLLRGYLRLGAQVCGAPAHDPDFRVADLYVLPSMRRIHCYLRHFSPRVTGTAGPGPWLPTAPCIPEDCADPRSGPGTRTPVRARCGSPQGPPPSSRACSSRRSPRPPGARAAGPSPAVVPRRAVRVRRPASASPARPRRPDPGWSSPTTSPGSTCRSSRPSCPAGWSPSRRSGAGPLLGPLAARGGTLFLDRERLRALPGFVRTAAGALDAGFRVVVFPRGLHVVRPRPGAASARPPSRRHWTRRSPCSPYGSRTGRWGPPRSSATTPWPPPLRRIAAARGLTAELRLLPPIPPGRTPTAAPWQARPRTPSAGRARPLRPLWPATARTTPSRPSTTGTARGPPRQLRLHALLTELRRHLRPQVLTRREGHRQTQLGDLHRQRVPRPQPHLDPLVVRVPQG